MSRTGDDLAIYTYQTSPPRGRAGAGWNVYRAAQRSQGTRLLHTCLGAR